MEVGEKKAVHYQSGRRYTDMNHVQDKLFPQTKTDRNSLDVSSSINIGACYVKDKGAGTVNNEYDKVFALKLIVQMTLVIFLFIDIIWVQVPSHHLDYEIFEGKDPFLDISGRVLQTLVAEAGNFK